MPDPTTVPTPLADFTPEELSNKVHALLEDWHSPTLSPIGLCRLLDLNIAQIRAIMALPMFAAILADIRFIQNARREWIFACAAEHAFDRLLYISHQTPTNAATCKEIRLAAKAILEVTGPPASQTDGPTSSQPSESVGGTGVPPVSPEGHAHDESANRGGGVPEPEASTPGLPNQPRGGAEGSGSTIAKEPAPYNNLNEATTPPRDDVPESRTPAQRLTPPTPSSTA